MSDEIKVTPERLWEVSPEFRRASQDTYNLVYTLDQATNSLVYEMYSAQLTRSPEALDSLWYKWHNALSNLAASMQTVADNLDAAAGGYENTDHNVMPYTP
ncbi:MAG: hypothetical protein NVSMB27_05440 [Ktedonobacteraceae bacterium]